MGQYWHGRVLFCVNCPFWGITIIFYMNQRSRWIWYNFKWFSCHTLWWLSDEWVDNVMISLGFLLRDWHVVVPHSARDFGYVTSHLMSCWNENFSRLVTVTEGWHIIQNCTVNSSSVTHHRTTWHAEIVSVVTCHISYNSNLGRHFSSMPHIFASLDLTASNFIWNSTT